MTFRKYIENLPRPSEGDKEIFNLSDDPYITLRLNLKDYRCPVCQQSGEVNLIEVYVPSRQKETIIAIVHPKTKPVECQEMYKKTRLKCFDILSGMAHKKRIEETASYLDAFSDPELFEIMINNSIVLNYDV